MVNYGNLLGQPTVLVLYGFIVSEYVPNSFSTSWSNYSMCATPEEELLSNVFETLSPDATVDYLTELPMLICCMIQQLSVSKAHTDALTGFLGDAMRDICECHAREEADFDPFGEPVAA